MWLDIMFMHACVRWLDLLLLLFLLGMIVVYLFLFCVALLGHVIITIKR